MPSRARVRRAEGLSPPANTTYADAIAVSDVLERRRREYSLANAPIAIRQGLRDKLDLFDRYHDPALRVH